ncbi:MAG: uracil-DNA glycosylase [Flavobacteriales bacterium]|nr:uracil-DNA glycosylase [Flavobacteriales bacterium]
MPAFEDEISAALNAALDIPGWGDALLKAMPSAFSTELAGAYRLGQCHPAPQQWFRAIREVGPPKNVRVVILGQDPYHGQGQADGLAFSVPMGQPLPPSLRNIYKEIAASCGGVPSGSGDLVSWASQGVLLLNDVLSVAHGDPRSHRGLGWQTVTSALLAACAERPAVFLLWGKHAQQHAEAVRALPQEHLILEAPHPSPLSAHRGFLGCGHFEQVNRWLKARHEPPIRWWPDTL